MEEMSQFSAEPKEMTTGTTTNNSSETSFGTSISYWVYTLVLQCEDKYRGIALLAGPSKV